MDDRRPTEEPKQSDGDEPSSTGGPVIIPAAAAFVGALIGAVVGSQLG